MEPAIRMQEGPNWVLSGKGIYMWLALAILFLIGWLVGFVAFHVTVATIHILLGLFVIFLIIHFIRRAAAHA
ncbi:MAG TPA: DUF5670 family protein [Terracidiphilus sp.]|nr:DUF5670 family protein [Terracidiphilus sp.]